MLRKQALLIVCILSTLTFGVVPAYAADEQPPPGGRVAGKVSGVDPAANSFMVETLRNDEVTVSVTGTTEFRSRAGEVQGIEDLETGMPVVVVGQRNAEGGLQADVVAVGKLDVRALRFRARGEITRIAASEGIFLLRTPTDEELEIHVGERTRFVSRDDSLQSIDDLEIGMHALVQGLKGADGQLQALRVAAGTPEERPDLRVMGRITRKGADSFTLETRQGRSLSFIVDAATQYRSRDGSVASFDDLEIGMAAAVAADKLDDETFKAIVVAVGSARETPARPPLDPLQGVPEA